MCRGEEDGKGLPVMMTTLSLSRGALDPGATLLMEGKSVELRCWPMAAMRSLAFSAIATKGGSRLE